MDAVEGVRVQEQVGRRTAAAVAGGAVHLRLDRLMWFAALSSLYAADWFPTLLVRLLDNGAATLRLLRATYRPAHLPARTPLRLPLHHLARTPPDRHLVAPHPGAGLPAGLSRAQRRRAPLTGPLTDPPLIPQRKEAGCKTEGNGHRRWDPERGPVRDDAESDTGDQQARSGAGAEDARHR